ncbi:MAG: hypothetical protein ACI9A2_004183 [Halioglobus sp.]|jgi:hypothetical protein
MFKTSAKAIVYALLALVLILLILALWLRFEFSKVERAQNSSDPAWDLSVASLAPPGPIKAPCENQYPEKRAWFGALHIHTAASYDATAFGVTTSVADAYGFGTGAAVALRLNDDPTDYDAPELRISSPVDFIAVTDHAEALGENKMCYDPASAAYGKLVCRLFRGDLRLPIDDVLQPLTRLATLAIFGQDRSARICGEDGSRCRREAEKVWQKNQRVTEQWLDRSSACEYTTFHAYEYTLAEEASNLHRNVIFKTDTVPQSILSSKEARTPESLWQWLDDSCISGSTDCDVLTIPHNSNWSSGRMWYPYSATDLSLSQQKEMSRLRARLEPLAEIIQVKGDSECRNGISSVMGAADEFCDFEKLRPASEKIADCGDDFGSGGMMLKGCVSRYSYIRYALSAGLAEQRKLGINPFKLGIIAATDTHNGTPAAGYEKGNLGSHGSDRDIKHRLKGKVEVPGGIATGSPVRYSPGGIAGVYAAENSRTALFEAMQNRETFGTSGPRISPRLFAGWSLPEEICEQPDWVALAYDTGVPMGGDLPALPTQRNAPVFVASATQDPRDGSMPLQRIQIVKGWVDPQGKTHQAIYEVAGDSDNGASVDPLTCEVAGSGFAQLCATWIDPDFDPENGAVYYARTLENPSCRWSQHDCISLPLEDRPASCSDPQLPKVIQERAWTSPIWYQP